MIDIVSSDKRSEMMSGIKGKNTKPEKLVRSQLHKLGYRFRIHNKDLPGKPDIVLKKYGAVVFVHGCFWHMHRCHIFKWPKTRPQFWRNKIQKNARNDKQVISSLFKTGWRVCVIWECSLKGSKKKPLTEVITTVSDWLNGDKFYLEISG